MEAAAKRFEQEDVILDEIIKQTKADKNMYSYPLSNMFHRAEADGYTPYCEIKFDPVTEFNTRTNQSLNNQECAILSQLALRHCSESEYHKLEVSKIPYFSATSTLCSLSDPLKISFAPKNVSPV